MGRSIVHHDPRSRAYPARGALFAEDAPLRTKVWRRGQAYDQDDTSWCVPETGKGLLNTAPFSAWADYRRRARYPVPVWYDGAQANDEWAGADYDGTSALGLLRYLLAQGVIGEYRWCFGVDDVLRTLSYHGPVGIGSWWRRGMDRPGPDGRGLTYTGAYRGGHEWELFGIDVEEEEVEAMNSWGPSWGDRGRFRLPWGVLGEILADDGDAFTLVAPGSVPVAA
jgi:hypothetical protein